MLTESKTLKKTKSLTKIEIKEYVKNKLASSEPWMKQALLKIFEFQTEEEKDWESTHFHNGVGFTGVDGKILSSFAKQLQKRGWLSPKQMDILKKKMPKYWKQIIEISDKEKLEELVRKAR